MEGRGVSNGWLNQTIITSVSPWMVRNTRHKKSVKCHKFLFRHPFETLSLRSSDYHHNFSDEFGFHVQFCSPQSHSFDEQHSRGFRNFALLFRKNPGARLPEITGKPVLYCVFGKVHWSSWNYRGWSESVCIPTRRNIFICHLLHFIWENHTRYDQ